MIMKSDVLIPAVLVVLMALVFSTAWGYPYQQAKLAPLGISGLIFILAAVQLIKELRTTKQLPAESIKESTQAKFSERRRMLIEASWVVGFIAAIYILGFVVAVFSFSTVYMKSRGAKWSASIIFAAVMGLIIWAVSSYLLGFRLYPGLIFRLLGVRW